MSREFDFIDLYYLNDVQPASELPKNEISLQRDIETMKPAKDVIEISDMHEESVMYTYAKFFEVLDSYGLEGLINT